MPRITNKNVFRNPKFVYILRLINAYDEGLEFKHIAYLLIGKEKLRKMGYISLKTCKEIPVYLEKHKILDYALFPLNKGDRVKNPERLSECLSILKDLGLINKVGKKYRVNVYGRFLCWIVGDVAVLESKTDVLKSEFYGEGHFPVAYMDSRIHVFSKDSGVNGFLRGKYRVKFDEVVNRLKGVLLDLDQIRYEILSNELRGDAAREFNEKHDWFVDFFYGAGSNICVVLNTFESITEMFSFVDKRFVF